MKTKNKKLFFMLVSIFIVPSVALAQTKVGEIINNICDWLSGEIAAAVAVLVVIMTGYELLRGEIEKQKAFVRALAIGLIIGGSYIAKMIFS